MNIMKWAIQRREVADRHAIGALFPESHAAGESIPVRVEQFLRHAAPPSHR